MHIAHKREQDSKTQSLKEHLEGTAEKARHFGGSFNNGGYAYACGLLHDIGKYSKDFQKKIINSSNSRVDHSTGLNDTNQFDRVDW